MYDPHNPSNQPDPRPSQPPWPPAPTAGAPTGPPAEPFPRLPTGPPPAPPDPTRGARPWILAAIGLTLVAVITWGSIVLFAGDGETGTMKPGAEQPGAEQPGDEPGGEEPTTAGPGDDGAGVYSLPAQPCDLVDITRLERQYGPVTREPMETVQGDPSRVEVAVCQATFGPNEETRLTMAMAIVHDETESTTDAIANEYSDQFTEGCQTVEEFPGNWEFGVLGAGDECALGGGGRYTATNVVVTDGNALWATQIITADPARSQGDIQAMTKTLAQEAVIQARRQATGG